MGERVAPATTLGVVGLGHMGGNMASRFLAAGYSVFGEARHREGAQELEREGLQWRDTPRELAEAAEVVLSSLPDDAVLEQVTSGPDGVLSGLSTDDVPDAPVSGSLPQVQSGTLTIMVGGDEEAYTRVEPILRELGTPHYIGENGHGLVLKLAINISLAVQMLAFSEGLLFAERSGVDRKRAVEVMTESPIGSPMLKARAELVLDLPDDAWFDVDLMQKDIVLALDAARELSVPLPSAAVADEVLTFARAAGYEHRDLASLFEVLARLTERH